ncbi:WD40-like repeat protein [Salinarchaeum sp. Harcht-Bsk1]|uniref:outer membrane protein assembly factor BamB family protein n=1 Tax=Salinarchaeum sp. Harcht-Bsk1 TaxID=1333523 RepID=UPI0003423A66|nr:PQQ-binding-like beta-propeller repeat protein [Salinarchaeum sp. Harcht-Bsk1]AGN01466.1 WD40-like repeat protein [Salinarchaeum sp. Harcht-Bsk1]
MNYTRRDLLATTGTLGIGTLAGCTDAVPLLGDDSDSGPSSLENDVAPDEWPGFQRTITNSGFVEDEARPTSEPAASWNRSLSGGLSDQPAVVDAPDSRLAIAVTEEGTVHALDAASGEDVWSRELDGASGQCPAVAQGLVVVGTDAGTLYALVLDSGDSEWSADLPGPVSGPTIAGDTVFVGTAADEETGTTPHACAVPLESGELAWSVEIAENAVDYPAVAGGNVYFGAEWTAGLQGHLHALDPADGTEQWHREGARMQPPTATEDFVLAPHLSPRVYGHTGRLRARNSFSGHVIGSPATDGELYYTGTTGRYVFPNELVGPGPDWFTAVGGRPTAAPALTESTVYVTRAEDDVVALDRSDGAIRWSWNAEGDVVTGPTVADGAVFVGTAEGTLIRLE